jgi:hypothetical protein
VVDGETKPSTGERCALNFDATNQLLTKPGVAHRPPPADGDGSIEVETAIAAYTALHPALGLCEV